jgi:hypothetical protein
MGMPNRHISPQSFDEILSELGDDPAIPDPHGFRKPGAPTQPQKIAKNPTPLISINLKKLGPFIGLGIGAIALGIAIFTGMEFIKEQSDPQLLGLEQELGTLKNEVHDLRNEILEIEDSLYGSIDEIEVSIHSFNKSRVFSNQKPKVEPIPFLSDLRHWHYLGVSQVGNSQKAFFQNGKETVMLEMGSVALGEWQLTGINRESATFSHPKASPLTIKAKKSE